MLIIDKALSLGWSRQFLRWFLMIFILEKNLAMLHRFTWTELIFLKQVTIIVWKNTNEVSDMFVSKLLKYRENDDITILKKTCHWSVSIDSAYQWPTCAVERRQSIVLKNTRLIVNQHNHVERHSLHNRPTRQLRGVTPVGSCRCFCALYGQVLLLHDSLPTFPVSFHSA